MKKPTPLVLADLEPWDRELVKAVVAGLSHAEIAERIGLKKQSVSNRISQLGKRLRVPGSRPSMRIMRWAMAQKYRPEAQPLAE